MKTERDKTIEALQIAIQMEIDGKEYYLKASQKSGNELGKKLLESLAAEEDIHLEKFNTIYKAIKNKKAWPAIDFQPDRGKKLRTIFAQAVEKVALGVTAPATELDAIQIAMDMENKTYDFYVNRGLNATYEAEREFYQTVADEERAHHQALLDYYEFLTDPASWFVKKEHPSLDGG